MIVHPQWIIFVEDYGSTARTDVCKGEHALLQWTPQELPIASGSRLVAPKVCAASRKRRRAMFIKIQGEFPKIRVDCVLHQLKPNAWNPTWWYMTMTMIISLSMWYHISYTHVYIYIYKWYMDDMYKRFLMAWCWPIPKAGTWQRIRSRW